MNNEKLGAAPQMYAGRDAKQAIEFAWPNGNESLGMCTISTRPIPRAILKAIRAGVGFGSRTETRYAVYCCRIFNPLPPVTMMMILTMMTFNLIA